MPQIIGFIGPRRPGGLIDRRYLKRQLVRKITKQYYDKENVYISGLKLGADTYFAEIVEYLILDFHAVVSVEDQTDILGKEDRAKFNRIIRAAHSVYEVYNIPKYRIKNKKRQEMINDMGRSYMMDEIFLKANKFIIDMADTIIFAWKGKRASSNTYRSIVYAQKQEKDVDVIHVANRYKI